MPGRRRGDLAGRSSARWWFAPFWQWHSSYARQEQWIGSFSVRLAQSEVKLISVCTSERANHTTVQMERALQRRYYSSVYTD
jgi:hypothetical protein